MKLEAVSILIRPPRRADVTVDTQTYQRPTFCFNPHPPRRADVTLGGFMLLPNLFWFQSSSAPKSGCNVRPYQNIYRKKCFNPHPPRRADVTAGQAARAS